MTIAELKKLRETEDRVEFKEAKHSFPFSGGNSTRQADRRKCFLGYVAALSNEGGGKLVFGMTDAIPHQVVGSDFGLGRMGAIENDTMVHLGIRIHYEELFEDNKRVLVVYVPSRPIGRLMKYEGVALMRTGDSLRNMTDDEVYNVLSEQEPDFSAKICPGLTVADLDDQAIESMKDAYAQKQQNLAFRSLATTQVLSDLKLLVQGRLNYAALILLGKKEKIEELLPNAKTIWEFRFHEPSIPYDQRQTVSGPLFLAIDDIWQLVNLRNAQVPVQQGAYIFGIVYFNETVIREAILNAIAHRDYTIASEIVIKQYPKKIIIINPGGFPKGVSIENLLTISSTPRSRLMSEVLEKTGLVERSGQGVDKIYSISLVEGKPEPDYTNSNFFQVSLVLDSTTVDKAFHVFITEVQMSRSSDQKLGVEAIIALYKIKCGRFSEVKPEIISWLESQQLIKRAGGNSLRYIMADEYQRLAEKEQRIGTRYLVLEIEHLAAVLQGKTLKIGELETDLTGSLNRNQIKYLVTKLYDDMVITSEGTGRGTRYKLAERFSQLRGTELITQVVRHLRNEAGEDMEAAL